MITVRQLSRFELSLKHVVRIDHALVFSTPKGGYEAYPPPARPSRGEIAARRYTAVYEVDMGVHPFTETLTLPSDNDAFEFTAEVDLSWQVLDPARFVASGVRDVPALLIGELQQAARPVTRRFAVADSARAERELLNAVTVVGPLGAPAGLQVTWTLRLRRDQANIDHQQRLQAIDHSAAEQIRAASEGMRVDKAMDGRHRQQDELQAARALEYGRRQQELAMQQHRWQHEQAMLQGQQVLELQQIEAKKIEFYQWHLSQGGVQSWALHLAQHPEDSHLVMTSMREDQLRMIQAQMELVKELLGGEGAEKFELEGPKQLALRTVSDILNQRLPESRRTRRCCRRRTGAVRTAPRPHRRRDLPGRPAPVRAPSAHRRESPAYAPSPHAPSPYPPPGPYAPSPGPYAPPPVPGAPPAAAAPYMPPPAPPAWQPPPGYGTTPTAPTQQAPAEPTPAKPVEPAKPTEPEPAKPTDEEAGA